MGGGRCRGIALREAHYGRAVVIFQFPGLTKYRWGCGSYLRGMTFQRLWLHHSFPWQHTLVKNSIRGAHGSYKNGNEAQRNEKDNRRCDESKCIRRQRERRVRRWGEGFFGGEGKRQKRRTAAKSRRETFVKLSAPSSAKSCSSACSKPTWTLPRIIAIVAGVAPCCLTTASTSSAVERFCGKGIPWALPRTRIKYRRLTATRVSKFGGSTTANADILYYSS